jgi:hypothetical protein
MRARVCKPGEETGYESLYLGWKRWERTCSTQRMLPCKTPKPESSTNACAGEATIMKRNIKRASKDITTIIAVLFAAVTLTTTISAAADIYKNDTLHWLYIGWENDHPKSWTFMGGAVAPGQHARIQYAVRAGTTLYTPDEYAADRKPKIKWYLSEGYLPSPVSEWDAGHIHIKIQHFVYRILNGTTSAVYSRISLKNNAADSATARILINASSANEIPLSGAPSLSGPDSMCYDVKLSPGQTMLKDFVALSSGSATTSQLAGAGGFDDNYAAFSAYYKNRIQMLTHPVTLPDSNLVNMFKNAQITTWESMVKTGSASPQYELRGSGGSPGGPFHSYDLTYNHDVPNMATQLAREGDFALVKNILASNYYQANSGGTSIQNDFLDAVPKYILPFAEYLKVSNDTGFFTAAVRQELKDAAHRIHDHRYVNAADSAHNGIMEKSNTLDNGSDFLVCDNCAALHGLCAYYTICHRLNDTAEVHWAQAELSDLNNAFNRALSSGMTRRKADWYMANFDDNGYFYHYGYDGNWIASSLMTASFPWEAQLRGFDLGGTWKTAFDASIKKAFALRDAKTFTWGKIPDGSWGAWWKHEYGAVYNAGQGLSCLTSETYRLEPVKNLTWLLSNQSAPLQWGESFDQGDWSRPAADYETWGLGFIKQTILMICASVRDDGTVIIGRGVPDSWTAPGKTIAWAHVHVNGNRMIDFSITGGAASVTLSITGDTPLNSVVFNLPRFKNNIASASAGVINDSLGTVTAPARTKTLTVYFKSVSARTPTALSIASSGIRARQLNKGIEVSYSLEKPQQLCISLIAMNGKQVYYKELGRTTAGLHRTALDCSLSAGVYLCRLTGEMETNLMVKKVIIK